MVFIIFKILFINLLKIFDIVRAFWIYTFVNDEVFSVLLPFQGMITTRALQGDGFTEPIFIGGETGFDKLYKEAGLSFRCSGRGK